MEAGESETAGGRRAGADVSHAAPARRSRGACGRLGASAGAGFLGMALAGAPLIAAVLPSPSPSGRTGHGAATVGMHAATQIAREKRFVPDLTRASQLSVEWELDGNGTWAIRDGLLSLEKAGVPSGAIRRPAALAILRTAPLADVKLEAELRSTAPDPSRTPRRDLLLVVDYQSPTRFYYVHISAARDDVHNGIFLVNDADRRRIDTRSDRAVLTDSAWHRFRLERNPSTGSLAVFVDDETTPLMTANDMTLVSGRVGVGSFDDAGEFRTIVVTGHTL